MSVFWIDGFEAQGARLNLNLARYYGNPGISQNYTREGRYSGTSAFERSLELRNTGFSCRMYEVPIPYSTLYWGMDFRSDPGKHSDILQMGYLINGGTEYFRSPVLVRSPDGGLLRYVRRSGLNFDAYLFGNAPVASPTSLLPDGSLMASWQRLELLWTDSHFRIYLAGEMVYEEAASGINHYRAGIVNNRYGSLGHFYDNMVMATGLDVPLGDVRILTTYPGEDVDNTGWTLVTSYSGQPHLWQAVDEDQTIAYNSWHDQDVSHLKSDAGRIGFRLKPGPILGNPLLCINLGAVVRIVGPTMARFRLYVQHPGGDRYYGANITVLKAVEQDIGRPGAYEMRRFDGQTYKIITQLWNVNPRTGAPWTEAELLTWIFGLEYDGGGEIRLTQMFLEKALILSGAGNFAIYRAR